MALLTERCDVPHARLTAADDLEFRSSLNAPSLAVEGMTLAGL